MTPAIQLARQSAIQHAIHEYHHEATAESYGMEAAEKLELPPERVFKTLVVKLDGRVLVVAVIPVASMLSMKLLAKVSGAKKANMAEQLEAERATGYVLGGVSPLGQKKRLKTFIDSSASNYETIFVSAGRRGLEIELAPEDLERLTDAVMVRICQ